MNLVAHQYLSFKNPDLQIGNLLGELVKGNDYLQYDAEISKGILLHRAIDSFTDSHEIVKNSSAKFHSTQHKYSPIIIDLMYDYFLIKHWNQFHDIPFNQFKTDCYQLFQNHLPTVPKTAQQMINHLIKHDWFSNYTTLEGIQQTLANISKRTSFQNNLTDAINEMKRFENEIEQDFLKFFPELIDYCKYFIHSK